MTSLRSSPPRWLAPLLAGASLSAPPASPAGAEKLPPFVSRRDAASGERQPIRRASRVVIISEDGLRGDVLSQMRLPWHEALYRRGSYSWKARTIRTASTLPSHAAMLSGFDVKDHGLSWNNWRPDRGFIRVPTIFETVSQQGEKTAMFVGKFMLRHIARPGTVAVFERPGYYCRKVALEAAEHIVRERPVATFVHFSNPDEAGHSEGWGSERYYRAVAEDDRCLGIILQALEDNGIADDTLVIVSSDHGGHNHTHSGSHAIDREIPWIARGPGVRRNYQLQSEISTVDTAATALDALGLRLTDDAPGRPITEIYQD